VAVIKDHPETGQLSFGILPGLVGFQLRMVQVAIFKDFAVSLGGLDITPGLFGALIVIEANPDLKQSDLARAVQLDRSTVVTLVDNLERRKLVERRASPTDRRSNALRLTDEGRTLLRTLKRQVAAHEKRLVANLTPDERQKLIELLLKIFPEHR
jgi:DNA-binding MarR family transcriptional regulator